MRLYVGNLSYNTTESDLREMFGAHGEITSAAVIMDRETGRSKGFGFVELADDNAGKAAIQALDGKTVDARQLKVNEARPQESNSGGNRGGGGGGRGGWR